jgi:hypothetical protein
MKCRDCQFLSEPRTFGDRFYPSVRCTKGLWDKEEGTEQWYSYGETILNRGPVRRLGEKCTEGKPKGATSG